VISQGSWKFIHYEGIATELFDLWNDPEEVRDLSNDPGFAGILARLDAKLREVCDPAAVNAQAFADQSTMNERLGGREVAFNIGARVATPPP
jgi:choline-sulfatase